MKQLDNEMIIFLQRYIQIDTSQPNPDYTAARELLKTQAAKDGFVCQEIVLPSGNIVLVITHQGTDNTLSTLALNHHMDVVPVSDEQWIAPPFAGEIKNGQIIGRGTQDIKGVGVVHYFALKELVDSGIKLKRTVHILAVPDEEIGGFTGTQELIQTDEFKQLNIGYVIDEGLPSSQADILFIKVSERKPIQVLITVQGELGHGSKLHCFNAIHELVNVLQRIVTKQHIEQQKSLEPGQLLSMNITSLKAGVQKNGKTALNVVPDCASATIDIRVPPSIKLAQVLEELENEIKKADNCSLVIEATIDDYMYNPDYESDLYECLTQSINQHNLNAKPLYFEATTDLRFYHSLGIKGFGFTPFTAKDNLHGKNEAIEVEDMIQGKNIFVTCIKNFCS